MDKFIYNKHERDIFRKLKTPSEIQNYINKLEFNFEDKGFCGSPRWVINNKKAHCVEGALFAAAVLEYHGRKPLILDLRSTHKPYDYDHVVAVFQEFGCFGAISKTNHGVLRYREPVYKNIRELVTSYFHEYFLDTGHKTLREYSNLFDLSRVKKINWRTGEGDISKISELLDKSKHNKILGEKQIKSLRRADKVEIKAGKIIEYKQPAKPSSGRMTKRNNL